MMKITKKCEPRSLTRHRSNTHSDYENYSEKDDLRYSLVAEQRGICCYCMGRIRAKSKSMKIEHWQCQENYPGLDLDYANLLGACCGGEGKSKKFQHCDTRKGEDNLKWNPANPTHAIADRVSYLPDGTIESPDDEFCTQLNDVLNLNMKIFKNNRKGVLDGIIEWWKQEKARLKGPVPKATLERKLAAYLGGGELAPYSGVAIWWISARLKRM